MSVLPLSPSTLPPELLEQILAYLPQKDLLLTQRTCRSFRSTIVGSHRLQKALFLAPDWWPTNPKVYSDGMGTEIRKPDNNRLLLRAFPGCYPTVTLVIVNDGQRRSQAHPQSPQAHGNTHDGEGAVGLGKDNAEYWTWDVCISFPSDAPPETHPSVLYPDASWRRMFLSQPPCTSLHLIRKWQRSAKPAIVRAEGITMGGFVDEVGRSGGDRERRDSAVAREAGNNTVEGEAMARSTVMTSWHQSYISSDKDWHFEGNIRYSDFCGRPLQVERDKKAAEAFAAKFQGYLFSRRSRNGVARAMSDEWDPGRAYEFGRAESG